MLINTTAADHVCVHLVILLQYVIIGLYKSHLTFMISTYPTVIIMNAIK